MITRKQQHFLAILPLLAFFFGTVSFAQSPEIAVDEHGMMYIPGEVVVKFNDDTVNLQKSRGMETLSRMEETQDFTTEDVSAKENIALISLEESQNIQDTIAELSQNPNVEYAQPNYIYTTFSTLPNDPYFYLQPNLFNVGQTGGYITTPGLPGADIGWLEAMDIWSGDGNQNTTGTTVAVMDVGIYYTQNDLINQMRDGTNCLTITGAYRGGCLGGGFNGYDGTKTAGVGYHGTHVAGIVGAETNNGLGTAGVNPHVKIMNINLGVNGGISSYAAIGALQFAKYNKASVVNMSRGGTCNSCPYNPDTALYNAMRDFPGLIAVAAGNRSHEHISSDYVTPADFATTTWAWVGLNNVISVAATNWMDTLWDGSDFGTRVSIAAPGCVYSSVLGNTIGRSCGTSMAAPHVAGAISLLWSYRPELSYLQVKNILLSKSESLDSLSGKILNAKRLNIYHGLAYLFSKQIDTVKTYTHDNKTTIVGNGGYMSGTSGYFEWTPSSISGAMDTYNVTLLKSGVVLEMTGLTDTGITLPLTGDGNYQIQVYTSLSGSTLMGDTVSSSFYVDTTAPTATISYSPISGEFTRGNVVATLTGQNEQLFDINTGSFTFTGNGDFVFTFKDGFGRTGSVVAHVDWIDKTVPTFTGIGNNREYTGNVVISFNDNRSGVVANLNGIFYTGAITVTGEGVFTLLVSDLVGNTTGASFSIDKTSPTVPTLITPAQTTLLGVSDTKDIRWSASQDTGVASGTIMYSYELYTSGAITPLYTGTISTTGTTIATLFNKSDFFSRRVRSCDRLNNCSLSNTGAFIVNIPQLSYFSALTSKEPTSYYQSSGIAILGIVTGANISIVGGTYAINSGAFTGATGTVVSGDVVMVKLLTSSAYSTVNTATLNVGGITRNFSVTTKAQVTNPSTPTSTPTSTPSSMPSLVICTTADLICNNNVYKLKTGRSCEGGSLGQKCATLSTGTQSISGNITTGIIYQTFSPTVSPELVQAYTYARGVGITTMPTIEQANMNGGLIRKHLAKMISEFAMNELDKQPDLSRPCSFTDTKKETTEMKKYTTLACQLGLMGIDTNGVPSDHFDPDQEITRAEFGTVLSRVLRGATYNGGAPFYKKHLSSLQRVGIMKNISVPNTEEIRGYVMLMLMRSTNL